MVRKLILAVVILAMAAVPVPALARDGGHGFHGAPGFHGRHEFHGGHERFEHFHRPFFGYGFYPYGSYPYPYYGAPYYFPRR